MKLAQATTLNSKILKYFKCKQQYSVQQILFGARASTQRLQKTVMGQRQAEVYIKQAGYDGAWTSVPEDELFKRFQFENIE